MPKASPALTAFNSGEFSPLMAGRVDLKYYANACKKLLNFIPMVQGPARNRPGTRHVREVKDSAQRTWLRRFVFNQEQSYEIEFGHLYARFYTNHGVIETSPGVPYEIVTPFTSVSLTRSDGTFRLQFAQSGDVLYITSDGQFALQKLVRLTATTFSIAALVTIGGPFEDYDPLNTVTAAASAVTGAVTVTLSSGLFTANHIGSLLYLEQHKVDGILAWEPGKAIGLGTVRRSDGKNYVANNAATTGGVKPIHPSGARYDGDAGVQWDFLDPGYGWVRIDSLVSPTVVNATVLSRLPSGAVSSSTTRWAFGAWSAAKGHPDNIAFFRERLCVSKGLQIFFSVAGDFENFNRRDDGGVITPAMSAIIDITSEEANNIVWMAPFSSALLVSTGGEEFALDEITSNDAFGPGNIRSSRQSKHGSNFAGTAIVADGVVYVQAAGRKVRDMVQAESVEKKWASSDTTVLAEHITGGGVISMVYQQEPDSVVWCAKADGSLAGFTLNREQDVRGWHPHRVGGLSNADGTLAIVECVDSIPIDGGDEVWMIVRRRINGVTKRYVEYMGAVRMAGADPEDVFHVDSGLTLNNTINATLTPGASATVAGTTGVLFTASLGIFVSGDVGRRIHYRYTTRNSLGDIVWNKAVAQITGYTSATVVAATIHSPWPNLNVIAALGWRMTVTTINGLGHLEGQMVAVCGDGAALPQRVVASGAISISELVSKVHVGLPYRSVLMTMPIEAGAADGTSQGKTKRASRCSIRFHETLGAKYGRDENSTLDAVMFRDAAGNMDAPPALFTGDVTVAWPDGYTDDLVLTIVQDDPLPCTVVAIMPQIKTEDNR